jgi:hypothetical protein
VGPGSLTITNLTDLNNLDSCKDFIQINIDLVSNVIEGGEYVLTITNDGDSYGYLTEVQDYQYNTLGTGIYSNSVILSNTVDAAAAGEQQTESDNTDTGTGTGTSTGTETGTGTGTGTGTDPNYNPNTDPTNSWNGLPLLTWGNTSISLGSGAYDSSNWVLLDADNINFYVANLPSESGSGYTPSETAYEVLITLTDSDSNSFTYTRSFSVDTINSQYADERYFTVQGVSTKGLNAGDVATIDVSLSNKNEIKATSQFNLFIPPSVDLYMSESLSGATSYRGSELNSSDFVEIYDDQTTGNLNIYAYVNQNVSASLSLLTLDGSYSPISNSLLSGSSTNTITGQSVTALENVMTEIYNGYYFGSTYSESYEGRSYVSINYSWVFNGQTISVDATTLGSSNLLTSQSLNKRTFKYLPTQRTTITLNSNVYNVEPFNSIVTGRPADPTNDVLFNTSTGAIEVYLAFINYFAPDAYYFNSQSSATANSIKWYLRETYTDNTVVEVEDALPYSKLSQSSNFMIGISPYAEVSFKQSDNTKTLYSVVAWIEFSPSGSSNKFIYNVNNSSVNAPEFYFEP